MVPEENDILVTDYFAMLGEELADRDDVKAHHRRAVVQRIRRSQASIEFKHRNISAVLMKLGLPRMRQVRWVADLDGDGAGYDVLSFDPSTGADKLIEVKTTCGDERTPFFVTRNEEALSREKPDTFLLYRLFDFSARPRIFELHPLLDASVRLQTATWVASFG